MGEPVISSFHDFSNHVKSLLREVENVAKEQKREKAANIFYFFMTYSGYTRLHKKILDITLRKMIEMRSEFGQEYEELCSRYLDMFLYDGFVKNQNRNESMSTNDAYIDTAYIGVASNCLKDLENVLLNKTFKKVVKIYSGVREHLEVLLSEKFTEEDLKKDIILFEAGKKITTDDLLGAVRKIQESIDQAQDMALRSYFYEGLWIGGVYDSQFPDERLEEWKEEEFLVICWGS